MPKITGAIAPSGEKLANLITEIPNLENAKVVIEFGPGTGVFTEKILKKIPQSAFYFGLELNPLFVKETLKRCPAALIYQDSAEKAGTYLKMHGLNNCDCIISGLPWGIFNKDLQDSILKAVIDVLRPGGEFLTFSYVNASRLPSSKRFKQLIYTKFNIVKTSKIVWKNIPPAFVYHCIK
ncbi:MAG: ribosomal RNA adenine dimethylase domain-containing protein [Nanoarchaeota archaeon]